MPNQNPDRDIPGMIFSREGKAAALRDAYQEIAAEVESLAQLAGGTEPDDDLSEAIAFLARAMGSLTNARRVALQEWAAGGGDATYTEAEADKLLESLGKIAREEKVGFEDEVPPGRVYGRLGFEKGASATGTASNAQPAPRTMPGLRRLDLETGKEIKE